MRRAPVYIDLCEEQMTMQIFRNMFHSFAPVGLAAAFGLSVLAMPAQAQLGDTAVFASHSAYLQQGATIVSGNLNVNEAGVGPLLTTGQELTIGLSVTTPAGFAVKADTLKIKSSAGEDLSGACRCGE